MPVLAPNIDLLFAEAGPAHDRVRAAAAAGFTHVEMWGTFEKDLPALREALTETGVQLTSLLAEPRTQFMVFPDHQPFYEGLARGVEAAVELKCPRIVVGSGAGFGGSKRAVQLEALVGIFEKALPLVRGTGVGLVLEAVNTRVDHPGSLLDRTAEALQVARGVNAPEFGLLYDLYHSTVEGEDVEAELAEAGDLIHYVQIADAPGRGEPGSGQIDWPRAFAQVDAAGYEGPVGLEYYPTQESVASLAYIQRLAQGASL